MCTQFLNKHPGPVHPHHTSKNKLCYFFYTKHHSQPNSNDAQWKPEISQVTEFSIFDTADSNLTSYPTGNLYGLLIENGRFVTIGTRNEQIATFPWANSNQPWHGYPAWPLQFVDDQDHRNTPVPTNALNTLESRGLINRAQKNRLRKGYHA